MSGKIGDQCDARVSNLYGEPTREPSAEIVHDA